VGAAEQVFISAPVAAAVSAALGCRDWRLVPSVAAPLLAAGRVAVGVGGSAAGAAWPWRWPVALERVRHLL